MMIKVGVTGGIGTGKSVVCRIFNLLGIPVYDADSAAKRLMETDDALKEKIVSAFGNIFTGKGAVDRQRLASLVFNDPEKLAVLNSIVHPAVKLDYTQWEQQQKSKYIIRESAILFESGTDKGLDYVITVSAPAELRVKRVMQRDGRTAEQVNDIMKRQLAEQQKQDKADFIIINDSVNALLPQVWSLHETLSHEN